jgi:hypothetical protein
VTATKAAAQTAPQHNGHLSGALHSSFVLTSSVSSLYTDCNFRITASRPTPASQKTVSMETSTPLAGASLHIETPPYPSPSTPRPASQVDGSDTEYDPTPLHSPGGPQYDDLPPSYHAALTDARNGVTPLDPSQLEAHRLTENEGPNEPEVWEYRLRAEGPDDQDDAPELAPAYESLASTVPIQYVSNSEDIPIGQTGPRNASSDTDNDPLPSLLNRALEFTRHQPGADAQFAPRLERYIAVPQQERGDGLGGPCKPVQMLRAYAEPLRAHSIQPAEFVEFLDGVNALCNAIEASTSHLLHSISEPESSNIVLDYLRGANEAFFAPRGLRVSLRSLRDILHSVGVTVQTGDENVSDAFRAILNVAGSRKSQIQALYPLVECIEEDVPRRSAHMEALVNESYKIRSRGHAQSTTASGASKQSPPTSPTLFEDPPHSIPEPMAYPHRPHSSNSNRNPSRRTSSGRAVPQELDHSAPIGPFGPHGLFGPPGYSPFGRPGNGPFGPPGAGPFNRQHPGRGRARGRGPRGSGQHPGRPGASAAAQDWQAWGQNVGRMGQEFGKMMSEWGQETGKQAAAFGQEIGREAQMRFGNVGSSDSASRSQPPQYDQVPDYDHAPPYSGPASQETGVHYRDIKAPATSTDSKVAGKQAVKNEDSDDNDDDDDSDDDTSSNSSDSDSQRAAKASKRAVRSSFKQRRRDLNREYREKKAALRAAQQHKGKGKGKATKNKEWKDAKREYRAKRKELKRERADVRREWKKERREAKQARREGKRAVKRTSGSADNNDDALLERVWLVVENLHAKR